MDWLRAATVVSLLAVAVAGGGAAVRLVIAIGDLRAGLTVGLLTIAILAAFAAGARGPRWRENPYW